MFIVCGDAYYMESYFPDETIEAFKRNGIEARMV